MNEKGFEILGVVEEVANEQGAKISQIALAWVLAQETITSPIIGANTVEQLEESLGAIDVNLTREQLERLEKVSSFRNR